MAANRNANANANEQVTPDTSTNAAPKRHMSVPSFVSKNEDSSATTSSPMADASVPPKERFAPENSKQPTGPLRHTSQLVVMFTNQLHTTFLKIYSSHKTLIFCAPVPLNSHTFPNTIVSFLQVDTFLARGVPMNYLQAT